MKSSDQNQGEDSKKSDLYAPPKKFDFTESNK